MVYGVNVKPVHSYHLDVDVLDSALDHVELDGFVGRISAHNYRTITDAASATATRDLAELVELGALNRIGERRHARYHLAIANKKGSDFANA